MNTEVMVSKLPDCDICTIEGYSPVRKAAYDFRTTWGTWANGCTTHYRQYRANKKLGTGNGRKLMVVPMIDDTLAKCAQCHKPLNIPVWGVAFCDKRCADAFWKRRA